MLFRITASVAVFFAVNHMLLAKDGIELRELTCADRYMGEDPLHLTISKTGASSYTVTAIEKFDDDEGGWLTMTTEFKHIGRCDEYVSPQCGAIYEDLDSRPNGRLPNGQSEVCFRCGRYGDHLVVKEYTHNGRAFLKIETPTKTWKVGNGTLYDCTVR